MERHASTSVQSPHGSSQGFLQHCITSSIVQNYNCSACSIEMPLRCNGACNQRSSCKPSDCFRNLCQAMRPKSESAGKGHNSQGHSFSLTSLGNISQVLPSTSASPDDTYPSAPVHLPIGRLLLFGFKSLFELQNFATNQGDADRHQCI